MGICASANSIFCSDTPLKRCVPVHNCSGTKYFMVVPVKNMLEWQQQLFLVTIFSIVALIMLLLVTSFHFSLSFASLAVYSMAVMVVVIAVVVAVDVTIGKVAFIIYYLI